MKNLRNLLRILSVVFVLVGTLYVGAFTGFLTFLFANFFIVGDEVFDIVNWELFSKDIIIAMLFLMVGYILFFVSYEKEAN